MQCPQIKGLPSSPFNVLPRGQELRRRGAIPPTYCPHSDGSGGRPHLQGQGWVFQEIQREPVPCGGQSWGPTWRPSGNIPSDRIGPTSTCSVDPLDVILWLLCPYPSEQSPTLLGLVTSGKQRNPRRAASGCKEGPLAPSLSPLIFQAGSLLSLDCSPGGGFLWLSQCLLIPRGRQSFLGSLLGLSFCGPPPVPPPPPSSALPHHSPCVWQPQAQKSPLPPWPPRGCSFQACGATIQSRGQFALLEGP